VTGSSAKSWQSSEAPADGRDQLRVTEYEPAAAVVLATGGYPGIEAWLDFFLRQTAGDDEALAVFGPRDGRRADR